ncbi:MAG: MerR family transcriptional regulator [Actinopolymorphaceae bacterium]
MPLGLANGEVTGRSIAHERNCVSIAARVALQPNLKSNVDMDLLPIGEAASRLGMNASALRYYDEQGLVRPTARRGGRRMYGPEELRRLAFIQIMQRLGMSLDTASAVLDEPSDHWREVVREQISALEQLIAQAKGAQDFLHHAANCPAEHPVRECPYMIEALDRRIDGIPFEQLAEEQRHSASAVSRPSN